MPDNCYYYLLKQNEENKKKNKQAALKAQMDLEEARQAASQATGQQNNTSLQDQEGGTGLWLYICLLVFSVKLCSHDTLFG